MTTACDDGGDLVRVIEDAVNSAKRGTAVSKKAARIHLFSLRGTGSCVQFDKAVALERTGRAMRRILGY